MAKRCPYCLSDYKMPDYPVCLEPHNNHYECGSQRIGQRVYRSDGCYQIREGKLERLLNDICQLPAPATDSEAWKTVSLIGELIENSHLMGGGVL